MPRKDYLNDLAVAFEHSYHECNIFNVRRGDEDGQVTFSFALDSEGATVDFSASIPELPEYPQNHKYIVYTVDDDAPASVMTILERRPDFTGKRISIFLQLFGRLLTEGTRTGGEHDPVDDMDEEDEEMDDWPADGLDDDGSLQGIGESREITTVGAHADFASRARADLCAVKAAGFKVGVLGSLQDGDTCYISVSCRIAKLGIAEEVMVAWSIEPEQYLVLLLCYKHGYKPLDFFLPCSQNMALPYLHMRTGISSSYKATSLSEAHAAFKSSEEDETSITSTNGGNDAAKATGFKQSFISGPLDRLLNDRLLKIIQHRHDHKLSWEDAEVYYNECQKMPNTDSHIPTNSSKTPVQLPTTLPAIVTADEVAKVKNAKHSSLPLIAMQFFLRHFVSAPSFCLLCHCKLDNQPEAIKPYVCDNILCVHQYMELGFGPAIDHEVMTQPHVVDLLVSFCYSSVKATTLHKLPLLPGLRVPSPRLSLNHWCASVTSSQAPPRPAKTGPRKQKKEGITPLIAWLNKYTLQLEYHAKTTLLEVGKWLVINCADSPAWHCRIVDNTWFPLLTLSEPLIYQNSTNGTGIIRDTLDTRPDTFQHADVYFYDHDFDSLSEPERYKSLQLLLDLMPGVNEMRDYLIERPGSSIAKWYDRMCPAALSLLRWIIASNRSCIMQVDRPGPIGTTLQTRAGEQRVEGVPNWLQFRFAMGAPDKEQRFLDAIRLTKGDVRHPTLFAWHGSGLHNWHNIIRESLNYDVVINGRAYGNGVYFARDFETSLAYTRPRGLPGCVTITGPWPHSALQVGAALTLAEIVNEPQQFQRAEPHYVVNQLDWIQPRYLFVQPCVAIKTVDCKLTSILTQDPAQTPIGSTHTPIVLPITAISRSRRQHLETSLQNADDETSAEDDLASVDTDAEDREILMEPGDPSVVAPSNTTPFTPSTITNLPTMPVPTYATSSATNRLMKDFRTLLTTQDSYIAAGNLAELGWYLDPEHVAGTDNIYQWIVELHSFPKNIPLGEDMMIQGIRSIVLEIRFHHTYPHSPPFIRVVRPRLLPFQDGGGGHVTIGGSLCMDILTNSGWTAVMSMESVLLQIRMAIMYTEPNARLDQRYFAQNGGTSDYSVAESVVAFRRSASKHGWVVPLGLNAMAGGS